MKKGDKIRFRIDGKIINAIYQYTLYGLIYAYVPELEPITGGIGVFSDNQLIK